jgi:hypothetical protein
MSGVNVRGDNTLDISDSILPTNFSISLLGSRCLSIQAN